MAEILIPKDDLLGTMHY